MRKTFGAEACSITLDGFFGNYKYGYFQYYNQLMELQYAALLNCAVLNQSVW